MWHFLAVPPRKNSEIQITKGAKMSAMTMKMNGEVTALDDEVLRAATEASASPNWAVISARSPVTSETTSEARSAALSMRSAAAAPRQKEPPKAPRLVRPPAPSGSLPAPPSERLSATSRRSSETRAMLDLFERPADRRICGPLCRWSGRLTGKPERVARSRSPRLRGPRGFTALRTEAAASRAGRHRNEIVTSMPDGAAPQPGMAERRGTP